MASTQSIDERLLKVLNQDKDKNKSDSEDQAKNKGYVIGLTGEWGIGKTHFWKNFYEEKRSELGYQKNAYVSLFGIDSLDGLKYEIAIQTQAISTDKKDSGGNSIAKSLFTFLTNNVKIPDIESNGFALSIGKNLITSSLFSLVKDTIICIDDLERKSDNLDIKDIMGLINHLKTEKNCKVVVILHQDKTDNQFQEYKEKVFDEIVHLTENFSIIKTIIDDDEMIDTYKEFYQKLAVKNIRFYERIKRDYQEITELVDDLSLTSKDSILRNLLIVRLADLIRPEIPCKNEDNKFIFDLEYLLNFEPYNISDNSVVDTINSLEYFFKNFIDFGDLSDWIKVITENIFNYNIDDKFIKELIEQDKISEERIQTIKHHKSLVSKLHNLDTDANFTQDFYNSSVKVIKYEHFNNLNFYYKVIALYNQTLAKSFKEQVEDHIIKTFEDSKEKLDLDNFYPFKVAEDDVFKDFVKEQIKNHALKIDFKDFFLNPDNQRNNDDVKKAVNEITKDDLRDVIWSDLGDYFRSRRRLLESNVTAISLSGFSLTFSFNNSRIHWRTSSLFCFEKRLCCTLLLQDTENLTKFT